MKRWLVLVIVLCLVASLGFVQTKPDDALKNLDLVETPGDLPARVKAGHDSITVRDLKALLAFLASDRLEGREIGTPGYDTASEYAASLFALWGLKPAGDMERPARSGRGRFDASAMMGMGRAAERTYLQRFELKETVATSSRLAVERTRDGAVNATEFAADVDYLYTPAGPGSLRAPLCFAGYGIQDREIGYDDYARLNVRGHVVLLLADAPGRDNPDSPFRREAVRDRYFPNPMQMFTGRGAAPYNKAAVAEKLGAVGVLMVRSSLEREGDVSQTVLDRQRINDEQPIIPGGERRRLSLLQAGSGRMPWDSSLPVVTLSREAANRILAGSGRTVEELIAGIEKTQKPASFAMPGVSVQLEGAAKTRLIGSQNVLALVEGSDPQLKDELVVLGAHLDHLGRRGDYIYNGADDNGSGSAAVLAMARALALNPEKPKRSVLFALWSGEEEGLLGSRYYVDHPWAPLPATVNVNIDMLSRAMDAQTLQRMARMLSLDVSGEAFKKIRMDRFISVSFSGDNLEGLLREANRQAGLDLYLRPSQPGRMARMSGGSDHASFGMKNVPWISFIASMHDDYHRPSDTVDKINADYFERMARYVYLTLWQVADRPATGNGPAEAKSGPPLSGSGR